MAKKNYIVKNTITGKQQIIQLDSEATLEQARTALGAFMPDGELFTTTDGEAWPRDLEDCTTLAEMDEDATGILSIGTWSASESEAPTKTSSPGVDRTPSWPDEGSPNYPTLDDRDFPVQPPYGRTPDHTPSDMGMGGSGGKAGDDVSLMGREAQDIVLRANRIRRAIGAKAGTAFAYIVRDNGELDWATYEALSCDTIELEPALDTMTYHASYSYSERAFEWQKQTIGSGEADGGIPGIFNVKAKYKHYRGAGESGSMVKVYFQASQLIPHGRITMDGVRVKPEVVAKITAAINSSPADRAGERLLGVLQNYGHFVALDSVVGGRITLSTSKELLDSREFKGALDEFSTVASARFTTEGVPVGAQGGVGVITKSASKSDRAFRKKDLRMEVRGGDENAAFSEGEKLSPAWMSSLKSIDKWKVAAFYNDSLVPIIEFLDPSLKEKCIQALRTHFVSNLTMYDTTQLGGHGGDRFDDKVDKWDYVNRRIKTVKIKRKRLVDGVGMIFEEQMNGDTRTPTTYHGGKGGDRISFDLDPGEEINEVEVGWDKTVDHLIFWTTKGRRFPASGHYGGRGAVKSKRIYAPRVRGFVGKSAKFLDNLGLRYLDLEEKLRYRALLLALEPYLFN